jgi:hypothetical protein
MCEIIDVTGWVQLRHRFGERDNTQQRNKQKSNARFRQQFHRCPIVQDSGA